MQGIEHATWMIFLLTFLLLAPVFYYIRKAQKSKNLFVRKIPGIEAIEETITKSVEAGRPISFTSGLCGIGPTLYACLGVLFYIAKRAATFKAKLLVPQNDPEVLAITEDTVQRAYRVAKRENFFDPKNIPFLSTEQFAFAAGYIGLVQRERVGGAFLFGEFAAESLILAEAGQQIGAHQVGATVSPEQVAFFIVSCDYTLIGEEIFAASAYLSQDPIQIGSLYAQDFSKYLIVGIIFCGVIFATIQSFYPDLIYFDFKSFWTIL